MPRGIKKSLLAGSWYPGTAQELRAQIRRFIQAVPDPKDLPGDLSALIVPHAGYVYSGGVAAHAYRLLLDRPFSRVAVIAPSHRYPFRGASVDLIEGYETPLGTVPVDPVLSRRLVEADPIFRHVPEGHAQEHALEIQLPFLQEVLKAFQLIPIIQGSQDPQTCEGMAKTLARVFADHEVLLIASTDLSHFYSYDRAVALDRQVIEHVAAYDEQGLLRDLSEDRVEACGGGPMVTVMKTARLLGADRSRVLKYANSGDITGDRSGVVGYLAAALFSSARKKGARHLEGLTDEEKAFLHRLAREAIAHRLLGGPAPSRKGESPRLTEKKGAFVTLKIRGHLRGCIGQIRALRPLSQTVIDMAQAAAFDDPRFPPLSKEELEEVDLEISVLSPLRLVEDIKEIEVGKHGLYVERGYRSGLLLPQVAVEYGWDVPTFLEQTCLKAGLPPQAWKDKETKIYLFSAEVF
jgi:AmmeMemoRadiSam system protein B/AmmeMemoRadiSam system protein A